MEQTDYFTFHQGNGVSGGVRSAQANSPSKQAKGRSKARAKTSFTPFFQGITLGAVLLIPVGVWCWVRVDVMAAPIEVQETSTRPQVVKGKQAGAIKRKPMRAAPQQRPRNSEVPRIHVLVPREPGSPPTLVPSIPVKPPETSQIPRANEEEGIGEPARPKKSLWKSLSSAFRGRTFERGQPE